MCPLPEVSALPAGPCPSACPPTRSGRVQSHSAPGSASTRASAQHLEMRTTVQYSKVQSVLYITGIENTTPTAAGLPRVRIGSSTDPLTPPPKSNQLAKPHSTLATLCDTGMLTVQLYIVRQHRPADHHFSAHTCLCVHHVEDACSCPVVVHLHHLGGVELVVSGSHLGRA